MAEEIDAMEILSLRILSGNIEVSRSRQFKS